MKRANNNTSDTALNTTKSPLWCKSEGYSAIPIRHRYAAAFVNHLHMSKNIGDPNETPMLYLHTVNFKITEVFYDEYNIITDTKELTKKYIEFAYSKMCKIHGKDCKYMSTHSKKLMPYQGIERTSFLII